jgi:hypothetical protein
MNFRFKKIVAFIPAWLLYYAGDLVSKVMGDIEREWPYTLYSKLMRWSMEIQDWAKLSKPWKNVE